MQTSNAQSAGHSSARRFIHQASVRPLVTYARSDTKLLSLTAHQFRTSVYDLPLENEEYVGGESRSPSLSREQEGSEDSELSDAEPVRQLITSAPLKPSKMANPGAKAKVKKTIRPKPAVRKMPTARQAATADSGRSNQKQVTKSANTTKATINNASNATPVRKPVAQRRLPVNELFLVTSPVDYGQNDTQAHNDHEAGVEDPVQEFSTSPQTRTISSKDSCDNRSAKQAAETRLDAIKSCLKAPPSLFKTIKKPKTAPILPEDRRIGDGFDDTELKAATRRRPPRKIPRKCLSIPGFAGLQISSGPLPDVEFEDSTDSKIELELDDCEATAGEAILGYSDGNKLPDSSTQISKRRVSFNARVKEDLIMAELSSVKAPARMSSDPDSDEEADTRGLQGDCESEVAEYSEDDDEDDYECGAHEQAGKTRDQANACVPNKGVTMDVRSRLTPGHQPWTTRTRPPALMDVEEAIVEVPKSDMPQLRHGPENKQRRRVITQDPVMEPSLAHPVSTGPRSILKNSAPRVPDSTTNPSEAATNTRRNSFVDLFESRYFAAAADLLRTPSPASHTIVPGPRCSSYFEEEQFEALYTDAAIPETSPVRRDYVAESDLNVLRWTVDGVWTSRFPTAAKDLKSLTRSVSREHGTLSQAVRRRPSLPFQSPTKVG